jgi:hypothetical protein
MDHHECTTGGGVGCTSDETFSLIHGKINECEKVFFFIEHEVCFLNGFFYWFFDLGPCKCILSLCINFEKERTGQ